MDVDGVARPRFKSCVEPISSDDGLFLLSEGRRAWMPDPIFAALAPMLDGAHGVEAIFEALSDTYPVEEVFAALDWLRTSGYLTEDIAAEARPTMAFWEQVGVAPTLARSRLDATPVSIVAFGEVEIAPLADLLERQAIKVAPEANVAFVVTDNYLRPDLAAWNARSLTSGKAWLLMKPVGIETWIGPMFVPGRTACWECLAQRLRGHRKLEEYIHCVDAARSFRGSSNGNRPLDRNCREMCPPRLGGVDQRPHAATNSPQAQPPSPVSVVRISGADQWLQAGAPATTPKGPHIGRRASRPRPTGGA
jgi:hypothetical protein